MLCCFGLIALLTACCIAKTGEVAIQATLYKDGGKEEISDPMELAGIAVRLVNTSNDVAMLIVSPDLVESIKSSGTALEIVWPDSLTVNLPTGFQDKITRVLLPLSGDYAPAGDSGSVLVFYGTDKGYVTAPVLNHAAREDLERIRQLLDIK
jgi:hypothetical protein